MSIMMPERTPDIGWFLDPEQMAEHAAGFRSRLLINFPQEHATRALREASASRLGQHMYAWVNGRRYEATAHCVRCDCPSERFFLYVPLAKLGVKLCWSFDNPQVSASPIAVVAIQYVTIERPPLLPTPNLLISWMHEWGMVPRW